ncbi:MAG: hypothetical protein KC912_16515 [Proteobacteria bacterium]|nr:hypothetical protein [Pseudomonadota bacterium]
MVALVRSFPVLRIDTVQTDADLERFLDFADRVYAKDPSRVTPLRANDRRRLNPKSAFFKEADLVLLMACRNEQVVGTISVLRDRRHQKHRGEPVVFFGFFECDGSSEVASALFDAAKVQARKWGGEILRGPRNLTRIEETGLMIDGFDQPSPMLSGHHPREYQALLEAEGFVKHHDVLAYDTPVYDEHGNARALPEKLVRQADAVDLPGLEVRSLSWMHVWRDLNLAYEVFVDAFRDVPENTPMPRSQFLSVGIALLLVTNRHMLQIATVNGEAAGFALCFPELNGALHKGNGRLGLRGVAKLAGGLRTMGTASFKLLGVLPAYRGSGLHAQLIRESINGVRSAGYDRVEASLIDERNGPMRHIVEGAGMTIYKRFRVYEMAL